MVAPLDVGNLVQETSVTTGTGNQTLVSVDGKRTFNTEFGTGGTDVFYYFISNPDAAEWEFGTGHMSTSTVLVRDTVIESSNADAAVSFTAATKFVTNDLPASFHGGQWNLLETVVASNDASISVTGLTDKYFVYKFIWYACAPVSDGFSLVIRTSHSGAFDSGASDYAFTDHDVSFLTSPGHNVVGDNARDWMIVGAQFGVGTGANETTDVEITVFNPSGPVYTKVTWEGVGISGTPVEYHTIGGGVRLAAEAVDGVQFLFASGNIDSGTLKVYGIRA